MDRQYQYTCFKSLLMAIVLLGTITTCSPSQDFLAQIFTTPGTFQQNSPSFGFSVAMSDSLVLIGAPSDETDSTLAGRAHLFDRDNGLLLRTFSDPTPSFFGLFGISVAISDDGSCVFIASFNSVCMFDSASGQLIRTFDIEPGAFSNSLISVHGNLIVIGEPNGPPRGQAHLFDNSTGKLIHTFVDPTPSAMSGDRFGLAVRISGNSILIGAPSHDTPDSGMEGLPEGEAHLFNATTFELIRTYQAPSPETVSFGDAVDIDGEHVLIGAPLSLSKSTLFGEGQAYLFAISDGALIHTLDDQVYLFVRQSLLLADVNRDGLVNLLDVGPFVDLIQSGGYQAEADLNQDWVVNLLDIPLFIDEF